MSADTLKAIRSGVFLSDTHCSDPGQIPEQ